MKKILTLLVITAVAITSLAQVPVQDKSRQRQWQAMELGDIDFTPKEYYRIMHGEPDALNLWQGDNYAVYDKHWQWSGFHSGWEWKFNAEKSKATNLAPKRIAALAELILIDRQYEEMMDSLNHQFQRELSKAADCEIDKYYEAYKPTFQKYDNSITNLLAKYLVDGDAQFENGTDKFFVIEDMLNELNVIRETAANTHNAYMESMLKEEVYADLLNRYKKLNKRLFWRVYAVENSENH